MTITLNRKLLIGVATLVALIVGAMVLAPSVLRPSSAATASPEQVAAGFARAYYTADYRDQQAWLRGLKPHMTEAGFKMLEVQIAPAVWKTVSAAKFSNTAEQVSAEDKGLALEGETNVPTPKSWQIRRVQVTLAPGAQWPGMTTNSATLNILLERSQNDGAWQVSTTLSDQSVEMFKQQGKGQ